METSAVEAERRSGAYPAPEDGARAGTYSLLAALLREPPSNETLAALHEIDAEHAPAAEGLPGAWAMVRVAANHANSASTEQEFQRLFIGIGRGELVPFASWYRTGFLMERPLSALRADLRALGFERCESVKEPEDHAAALCEVMAMLVTDTTLAFDVQRTFYCTHLEPWIERFFGDLEAADSATFYAAVGRLGTEFMRLERQFMAMPA